MAESEKNPYIEIFYEKNPLYRTIFVDGAIGNATPTGSFNLTFYATRKTLPKSVKHEISTDGSVSPIGKASDDSKNGIIREIEVGMYMNKDTAKELYKFLKTIFEEDDH
jgi:uncharacterized alpha/beta hydrolase family protein